MNQLKVDRDFAINALLAAIIPCAVFIFLAYDKNINLFPDTVRVEVCYKQTDLDRINGTPYGQIYWAANDQDKQQKTWRQDNGTDIEITQTEIRIGTGFFSIQKEHVGCFSTDVTKAIDGFGADISVGPADNACRDCWVGQKIKPFKIIVHHAKMIHFINARPEWTSHARWYMGPIRVKQTPDNTVQVTFPPQGDAESLRTFESTQ